MKSLISVFFLTVAVAAFGQHIAVLSDVHVSPGNEAEKQLKIAVDEINRGTFDFVVMDGDLTNEGSDAELANVKSILDGIKAPLYVLPGNHENNWSQSAGTTFPRLWDDDRFVADFDSLLIVGINCGPYMKMGDGHIKQEDLHWLDATLAQKATPSKRVLSFNHYPLNRDIDNIDAYLEVLERYPVVGHINGHYHSWKCYMGGDINAVSVRALDMKNDHGYTIVDIDRDWIHVYDKPLGAAAQPKYAFPTKTAHTRSASAALDAAVPEGWNVTRLWADSASIFTIPAVDASRIYFGTSTGAVRAVDTASGRQAFSIATGAPVFSRPAVLPGRKAAFPVSDGIIIAKPDGKHSRLDGATPYVADGIASDKYWIQGGYKRIDRRDPRSGRIVWSYDSLANYCQGAPVVDGNDVIFGAWDTYLRCLDLRSGRLRWKWNNGKSANMLGPGNVVPVVTDSIVLIVAPDRYITAIDRATGHTLWRDNSHRFRESLGTDGRGTAFAKTMDGSLVAVEINPDGYKELWATDLGIGYDHAPCPITVSDGVSYVGSRRGVICAVDAATGRLLWSFPAGTSEVNGFAVAPDGTVYATLIEGTVWRINKNR